MKKLRWGILSAANIAYEQFLPAIQEVADQEIVAIASKSPEKVAKFGIAKVYETYEALLNDDNIDAIYIPLPNNLHKEWAIKAMEAKKHVLLEKPATLTVKDLQEIKDVADKHAVTFMEGFMYQYHPQHNIVQQWIEEGKIGNITSAHAHFSFLLENKKDIRLNKELGGGAIWDIGCYGIHALTQIARIKPTSVTTISHVDPKHEVDVTSTAILKDKEERLATVTCSFKGPFRNYYEIFGDNGSIFVASAFRPDVAENEEAIVQRINKQGDIIETKKEKANQYALQLEHFHACIKENRTPVYDINQSLEMIHYIEKAYESLHTGNTITV